VNEFAQQATQTGFYVSPSDFEVPSYQVHDHLNFPQLSSLDVAFDFSLLPPSIPWDEQPMLDYNADAFSTMEREAELEPSTSPAGGYPLSAIVDFDVPQNDGTLTPSRLNQSRSASSPHSGESDKATALVCYDCQNRPSFGHRHEYK
jgi:hypothetical protein